MDTFGSHRAVAPTANRNNNNNNNSTTTTHPSNYLLDRLQERRSQSKRSRRSDFGPRRSGLDDDIFLAEAEADVVPNARLYDSSPVAPTDRRPSIAGSETHGGSQDGRLRKRLGVRETEEKVEKLSKENFDLKLDLYHLRKKMEKMQEQNASLIERIANVDKVEEVNRELMDINDKLVKQLELREQAVNEAVDVICELESKVDRLEAARSRPSTAQADTGYCGSEMLEVMPPSSPPEVAPSALPNMPATERHCPPAASAVQSRLISQGTNAKTPARRPSFLNEKTPGTHALRTVYLEPAHELHSVKSFTSLLSRRDSRTDDGNNPDLDVLMSPRLSVLSESSFPSIYSPKRSAETQQILRDGFDHDDDEEEVVGQNHKQDSISRAQSNERQLQVSDNNASPTETLPALKTDADLDKAKGTPQPKTPLLGGTVFGSPLMPPTPDTVSTRMLRGSRSSMLDQKSLLDGTPGPARQIQALLPSSERAVHGSSPYTRSSFDLHDKYRQSLSRGSAALNHQEPLDSSEESDDEERESSTLRSIITGTPSRFQIRHVSPPATNMMFDGYGIDEIARSVPRRRNSEAQMHASSRRPTLDRAETSPPTHRSAGPPMPADSQFHSPSASHASRGSHPDRPSTSQAPPSQRHRDGSLSSEASRSRSSNRLSLHLSPPRATTGPSSKPSASPAVSMRSSLSQKTQKLFRRMNSGPGTANTNPNTEPPPPSPLAATSSTPIDQHTAKRPSTADRAATFDGRDVSSTQRQQQRQQQQQQQQQRPPPSPKQQGASARRPSLQNRTETFPRAATAGPRRSEDGNVLARQLDQLSRAKSLKKRDGAGVGLVRGGDGGGASGGGGGGGGGAIAMAVRGVGGRRRRGRGLGGRGGLLGMVCGRLADA
ncbi:hypothetical protein H2203_008958 [Taxawa tesnikishii (nom. ined.)]|nr:hypothetical protein H2203_008958 [Dothideales sp. JES 119]